MTTNARRAVSKLPEIVQCTADMTQSYAAHNQKRDSDHYGNVWALIRNQLGETVEYRGTSGGPLERRRLDPDTDVNSLLLRRSLEGYEDLSSSQLPTASMEGDEVEFRGRRRRRKSSLRRRKRSKRSRRHKSKRKSFKR